MVQILNQFYKTHPKKCRTILSTGNRTDIEQSYLRAKHKNQRQYPCGTQNLNHYLA